MSAITRLQLNDGHHIPQFGLGVWQTPAEETAQVVKTALDLGYRHIDTAAIYGNEEGVGQAIVQAGLPRDELFVTTKLWNADQGYDSALRAFDTSLAKLGLEHVDLYLIHWPLPEKGLFLDSWKALIELRNQGRVKSIGVSNFRQADIETLLTETGVVPVVNQIECHPLLQQQELRDFNTYKGIATEAWSPLAQGGELLGSPVLQQLAAKHGKTPAQVVLRWHIQLGNIIFPNPRRPSASKRTCRSSTSPWTTRTCGRSPG